MSTLQKLEHCLAAIADPRGEGSRTFTQVFASSARTQAGQADARRARGQPCSELDGIVVSVKDLFDVAGHPTWAGSHILRDAAPAQLDAPVVARLRDAGAVLIGKTNMTEFAYSGLGLNPHFGTPANPFERAILRRIPGGSSSGAAIALTDRMAEISIGSDTGGSVRIPAALCGIVGWKPSASRITLRGVWPLAPSFDSVGVLARQVSACIDTDRVIADEAVAVATPTLRSLRLARLRGYVEADLEPHVAAQYEAALRRISAAGVRIEDLSIEALERIPLEQPGVTMQSCEAYQTHARLLEQYPQGYDPRVRQRLLLGKGVSAQDYRQAADIRGELQRITLDRSATYDAMLLPTVAIVAPPLQVMERDEQYLAVNRRVLRNTSLINFLDGCAVTLPCHEPDSAPVGLSIAAVGRRDGVVLGIARALESIVTTPLRAG